MIYSPLRGADELQQALSIFGPFRSGEKCSLLDIGSMSQ
jgi:hypothetical protein